MTPQEATRVRRQLKGQISRADSLAARCLAQVCDGDLRPVDRETAEQRLQLALRAAHDMDFQLQRVNEALEQ
jgi:hypothetical protein